MELLGACIFVAVIFFIFDPLGMLSSDSNSSNNQSTQRPTKNPVSSPQTSSNDTQVIRYRDDDGKLHTMTVKPHGPKFYVKGTRKTRNKGKVVQNVDITYDERMSSIFE